MEMKEYCFFIALFATVYWALKALDWAWFKPKKTERRLHEQGLKGNPYRLLYGDFKELKNMVKEAHSKPFGFSHDIASRVIPLYHHVVHKFGGNTYVWYGPKASVVITDLDLIKEVTLNNGVFERRRFNPLVGLLVRGLLTYEGDKWAKLRKIITPCFHQDKLKKMVPAFETSVMETMSKWEEIVSTKGGSGSSSEVDVWPYIQTLTCDAISRTTFGHRHYEQGNRIFELHREQTLLILKAIQSPYIPGWRFMPTKMNRRMKEISKYMNNSMRNMINERMEAMRAGKTCEEEDDDDLLSIMLDSNTKELDKHGGNDKEQLAMSIQDVIDECREFYLAGQEATATLLIWTLIMLSKYSHWQTRAREEVSQLFGTKKPDFDGLNRMKIVTMILYEVLRLYPSGPVVTRRTTKETKLGKVTLPAETLLSLPVMLLHHDTIIWGEDALEFNPERFSQGISHVTKGQVKFFPFGWGPRNCIGQNFAMLEAKMAIALILQRFSFELSPSYTHAPVLVLTLQPQHGAHLILHKI